MPEQNGQPPGPSKETLAHLHGMLPSFAKGIAEKKAMGKGRKETPSGPRKLCPICGRGSDFGPLKTVLPDPVNCDDCAATLKEGYAALVAGDRFAFVKHPSLNDWSGKIVQVSANVLEQVAQKWQAKLRSKNETN